jgi:hypothetical protein
MVATAHKMAQVVEHLLQDHAPFEQTRASEYDRHYCARALKYRQRKAAKLGYTLTPNQQPPVHAAT